MELDILQKHKFQLINFNYVYHSAKSSSVKVQLNSDSHIMHICRGHAVINMENQQHSVNTGDVVAMPSFTPFTVDVSADFEMMNIHYKLWLNNNTFLENIKRLPLIFTPSYFEWCRTKLIEINEMRLQASSSKLPDPLAHEIILKHLIENPVTDIAGIVSDPRMRKIQIFLENPRLFKFDAGKLVSLCCLSRSQMNRNFKKLFAVSPQKYWEKQRMKNVCMTLKKSSITIYEMAEDLGFKDSGYFCRWFKKMTGHTPAEYRKSSSSSDGTI